MAFDPSIHAFRRQRFLERLGEAAAVIPAAPLATHHADCEWPFRQDSDFFYLTGFDEPDAVALLLPHRPEGERFVLFVQPCDGDPMSTIEGSHGRIFASLHDTDSDGIIFMDGEFWMR